MPTLKSLTSSEIGELLAKEDYKSLLDAVLASIHRDGGQYTILAGHQASEELALHTVPELYRKNEDHQALVAQLVNRNG